MESEITQNNFKSIGSFVLSNFKCVPKGCDLFKISGTEPLIYCYPIDS